MDTEGNLLKAMAWLRTCLDMDRGPDDEDEPASSAGAQSAPLPTGG